MVEEKECEEVLMEAAREAKKAFNQRVEEYGYDPAYFSIDLQAYQLSTNFKRFRHSVELYDQEFEEEKDD